MKFSVIIPTRNRPALLKVAIESVMRQTFDRFEIIIVNDNSDPEYTAEYKAIEAELQGKVSVLNLEQSLNGGHGQSYPINMGAAKAVGEYLCFLDDDDFWIDPDHLATAHKILGETRADVYFTKQEAYLNHQPTHQKLWLAELHEQLLARQSPTINGAFQVSVGELMQVSGFCHLNTTIAKKELYIKIKGMDENIRWECDRDFYFRLVDQAENILFNPIETSRHNIPDPNNTLNMSTAVSSLQKLIFRLYLFDKALLFSAHHEIKNRAKIHKLEALKNICVTLYRQQEFDIASYYAKEALFMKFNLKWPVFTLIVFLRRLLKQLGF